MSGTMGQIIDLTRNDAVTQSNLSYKAVFKKANGDEVITSYGSVIDKYLPLLKQHTYEWEMSASEFLEFRYHPKKLSFTLYGTTELWGALMAINQIYSVTQFNKSRIFIFNEDIGPVLDEILIKEKDNLDSMERIIK